MNTEINSYVQHLLLSLNNMATEIGVARVEPDDIKVNAENVEKMQGLIQSRPEYKLPTTGKIQEGEKNSTDMTAAIGSLTAFLPKTPIQLSIPGLPPIPLNLLVGAATAIGNLLFGGSSSNRDAQIQAEADAERAAQESHAADLARWRQEMKDNCIDMRSQFISAEKKLLRRNIEQRITPILEEAKKLYANRQDAVRHLIEDRNTFNSLMLDISHLVSELKTK